MRPQRSALLSIGAVALMAMAASGGACAHRYYSRGGGQNFHASRPTSPGRDGGWHGGGRHHGGWHRGGPGIVVAIPPDEEIIDDGDDDASRHTRRPRRRTTQRRPSGAPPAGEHRYLPDEVVIEVRNSLSTAQIDALQRRHRLTRIERQRFQLSGTTLFRWRIRDGRSVASVVRALEREAAVISAQPNYQFALQQDDAKPAAAHLPQYELAKLRLPQAHAIAKGDNVRVAVIDSAIDAANPELTGSIAGTFDAVAAPGEPHKHGTGIASLIAGHGQLTGTAPDARILAVRAFNPEGAGAQGTTFDILKGLDWAVAHDARVINMSFAGPGDPALHRSLAAAHKKGVVLVAAAGNSGPKSPPLYPAADPNVIAVTATDESDNLLTQANRGRYIDVAAPGVQILVAIPGGYEASSGTSYAAAEVSGIAALMLQRAPRLGPDQLRHRLLRTAKDLGAKGRDSLFGAGLADAFGAVLAEGPVTATVPRPAKRESTGAR
jgi:subtilisin family serine protease